MRLRNSMMQEIKTVSHAFGNLRNMTLLAAMIAASVVTGCDRIRSSTPQQHIQKAKDSLGKGDQRTSIIELKNALQQSPDNAEARLLLGEVYIQAQQGKDAEKELLRAQQLGVDEESIKVLLGQALLLQEDYERTLKEITPSARTSPRNMAKIQQLHGNAQLGLGRMEQGCEFFKQSALTDPSYVPTYWGLAKCAAATKDFDRARALLEQALKLDTRNSDTWMWLGKLAQARNDPKAAAVAYSGALKIVPDHVDAHLSLAFLHLSAGKFDTAQTEINAARKVAPRSPQAKYLQALLDFRQAKYTAARDNLQEVLKDFPNHLPSILLSGMVSYELGSYEQATQYLTKILNRFPDNDYARKGLAATWLKTGQPDRALDTLKPLLMADNPYPGALTLASEAALQANEPALAREYLQRAAAIDPKNAALRTALGVSHMTAGDSARAMAELESAAALDPGQHIADMVLLQTHLNNKEYDKALQTIAVLEKKQPNNPVTFNLKGAAYIGKNDFASARKSFEQSLKVQPTYTTAAINLAQLDLKDKNPQGARSRLENVLAKDKTNLEATVALANLAASQGQEKEYVNWLEKAVRDNPSALQPRAALARYYVQKKEPQKALAQAREAQTANPASPDALNLLGSMQLAADEKENALTTFRKLATLAPRSPLAHFKLAAVQAKLKNAAAAKVSLNRALELQPDYLEAATALASLEVQGGRHAEALRIAKQLQQKTPLSPSGFALESEILMAQAKYAEAARASEKAYILGKNGLLAVKVHQAWARADDMKKADTGLLLWLKEQPNDLGARAYLAKAYEKAGKTKLAIGQYELILQKEANNLFALNNLAWLYQQEKDPRALEIAEQAYKLDPDNASVVDTLGWILTGQGQLGRSVTLLENAVTKAPEVPEARYHYAVALAKSGDKAKARNQLEQALAAGKRFSQIEQARALYRSLQ